MRWEPHTPVIPHSTSSCSHRSNRTAYYSPLRLSPSAIPLAVITTPKSTDAGTEGSMANHPTTQGARTHASLPKVCLPLTDSNKSREKTGTPARVLIGIC